MLNRNTIRISILGVLAAIVVSTVSQASPPLKETNNLTFGSPVALPGVTLSAGTYVFERDSVDNSRIVRVKSPNYQKLLFVGFTMPVTRPRGPCHSAKPRRANRFRSSPGTPSVPTGAISFSIGNA